MYLHTTCPGCGADKIVTDDDDTNHHPGCPPPPPTPLDMMVADFVTAVLADDLKLANELEQQIDAAEPAPRLHHAAMWYAGKLGWPVFPLIPHTKRPATKNGFKDATVDLDRIDTYWKANPTANIGLPTGHAFDVIDIDVPEGITSYTAMLHSPATNAMNVHARATTSSGGLHLYIKPTGRGNGARIDPGIDYRGRGGYVVAPPSWLGRRGTSWSWLTMPSPALKAKGVTQ